MLRSSIPFGRLFGVEMRVHISFLLLLAAAVGYSAVFMDNVGRGVGSGSRLFRCPRARSRPRHCRALHRPSSARGASASRRWSHGFRPARPRRSTHLHAPGHAAAPIANFGMGLLLMGFSYGLEPASLALRAALDHLPSHPAQHRLDSVPPRRCQSSARRRDAYAPHPSHACVRTRAGPARLQPRPRTQYRTRHHPHARRLRSGERLVHLLRRPHAALEPAPHGPPARYRRDRHRTRLRRHAHRVHAALQLRHPPRRPRRKPRTASTMSSPSSAATASSAPSPATPSPRASSSMATAIFRPP